MRKLLLNLGALTMIGMGGTYFAQAQGPGDASAQACKLDGQECSDNTKCCVKGGVCYDTCPFGFSDIDTESAE